MGRVQMTFKAQVNSDYFHRIEDTIYQAVGAGLEKTLSYGEGVAKKHAPVRKVTKEGRGGTARSRGLTDAEISDLPDFAKKGLNPISGTSLRTGRRPQTTVKRSLASYPQPGNRARRFGKDARSLTVGRGLSLSLKNESVEKELSSRGRAELKRGRQALKDGDFQELRRTGVHLKLDTKGSSVSSQNLRATLGGRLRDEIHGLLLSTGPVSEGKLVSPTEYARYVEFPTSRTAAQPYMRPARDAMAAKIKGFIEEALNRAAQFVGGGR